MNSVRDKREVLKVFNSIARCLKKIENLSAQTKLIKIGTAEWTNALTEKPQKVNDLYVLGFKSANRPIIINKITISTAKTTDEYILNDEFTHANFSSFKTAHSLISIKGDGIVLPLKFNIEFIGQEFCNPITALHVLETKEKDIVPLLKVTLRSQNFDDAYSECSSVSNSSLDVPVRCSMHRRTLLLNNSSPLEMLLGTTGSALRVMDNFALNEKLRNLVNIEKDEVWAKAKKDDHYEKIKKMKWRKLKELYSDYYPVYDYKMIKQMNIEIGKDKYDLGVYGLGSAGTAILEQVCRSNWIKSIYLCDFDYVEAKNMINQWYCRNDIGISKTLASTRLISNLNRPEDLNVISNIFFIKNDTDLFQNTNLESKSFKYVISGFDSIKTRMEFLNAILDGKIEAKYLIDCRYLDLACSIYMIDLENQEEVEFYKANLEADAELINIRNEKERLTREEFIEWYKRKGFFRSNCAGCRKDILKEADYNSLCKPKDTDYCDCATTKCIDYLYGLYLSSLPNPKISRTDASCVKYNYIDIYRYVGAIVFGAFRNIENYNEKPFTLVEAKTDVKGLPNYMVVRR